MIIGNRICFGYGDIAVGASFYSLFLTYFKPPQEIGTNVSKDVEVLAPPICICFKYEECKAVLTQLDQISKDNNLLIIKDYILDFSNFNQGSVDVVKKYIKIILSTLSFAYAC